MGLEGIATRTCAGEPVAVLALYGEVTSETVQEMEQTVESLLRDYARLVVDFSHTLYVSSAGWRTLIDHCCRGPHSIRVACMQAGVRDVYDLLGLHHVLTAHDTVAAAVAAFGAETPAADSGLEPPASGHRGRT